MQRAVCCLSLKIIRFVISKWDMRFLYLCICVKRIVPSFKDSNREVKTWGPSPGKIDVSSRAYLNYSAGVQMGASFCVVVLSLSSNWRRQLNYRRWRDRLLICRFLWGQGFLLLDDVILILVVSRCSYLRL